NSDPLKDLHCFHLNRNSPIRRRLLTPTPAADFEFAHLRQLLHRPNRDVNPRSNLNQQRRKCRGRNHFHQRHDPPGFRFTILRIRLLQRVGKRLQRILELPNRGVHLLRQEIHGGRSRRCLDGFGQLSCDVRTSRAHSLASFLEVILDWFRSLVLRIDAAVERLDAVGAASNGGSDLQVLLPWVLEAELAVCWLPSREIRLQEIGESLQTRYLPTLFSKTTTTVMTAHMALPPTPSYRGLM
ncbi:unnamed protein product, partial [Linum tenue]